jgi:hypothetical protein
MNPQRVTELYRIPLQKRSEVDLHKKFEKYHKKGEWFYYAPEIINYFRQRKV